MIPDVYLPLIAELRHSENPFKQHFACTIKDDDDDDNWYDVCIVVDDDEVVLDSVGLFTLPL